MNGENNVSLVPGTEYYGWQYDWPLGTTQPRMAMPPVKGSIQKSSVNHIIWFVPYQKRTKRPAWTRAVQAELINLSENKADAEAGYNLAIQKCVDRFLGMANMCRQDLLDTGGKPPA